MTRQTYDQLRKTASTTKEVLDKILGSIASFAQNNPKLVRGAMTTAGAALPVALLAKLLGSKNALLWGAGAGAAATTADQLLLRNPNVLPLALQPYFTDYANDKLTGKDAKESRKVTLRTDENKGSELLEKPEYNGGVANRS